MVHGHLVHGHVVHGHVVHGVQINQYLWSMFKVILHVVCAPSQ